MTANRFCPVCEQVDDHPRHDPGGSTDPRIVPHLDCCAERGCPDGSCPITRGAAPAKLRGAELGAHLCSEEHIAKVGPLLEARDAETRHYTDGGPPILLQPVGGAS